MLNVQTLRQKKREGLSTKGKTDPRDEQKAKGESQYHFRARIAASSKK
jgi:hypothetical protein